MSSIYNQLQPDEQNKSENADTGKKKALGKGLNALISDLYGGKINDKPSVSSIPPVEPPVRNEATRVLDSMVSKAVGSGSGARDIEISNISASKDQPRTVFNEEKIEELADSIREQGVIQPVIVKKSANGFELICGERRLRAAKKAGLERIPAIIKEIAEDKLLEWALIENIQREDLNPIEEANAYLRLVDERQLSHEQIAKKVGKNRTTVVNSIRLLRLPKEVLNDLVEGRIQAGHARALLGIPAADVQLQLAEKIVKEGLTVRQVEDLVNLTAKKKRKAKRARTLTPELRDLENKMEEKFGTQVRIYPSKDGKQGRLEFRYYSLDDLDRILQICGLKDL